MAVVLSALVCSLAGCSADSTEIFLSVDAGSASYSHQGASGQLVLDDIEHGVVFISVSPETTAWTGSPQDLVDAMGDETLNAVVHSSQSGDALALALSEPVYDSEKGRLTFGTEPLEDLDTPVIGHLPDDLVEPTAGFWGPVTVFIDPTEANIKTPGVYIADSTNSCFLEIDNKTTGIKLEIIGFIPEAGPEYGPELGFTYPSGLYQFQFPGCETATRVVRLEASGDGFIGEIAIVVGTNGVAVSENDAVDHLTLEPAGRGLWAVNP